VFFSGLWVHALFSLLFFCYQYQCNCLPGKIRPRNDLLCVEWDVKPYYTHTCRINTPFVSHFQSHFVSAASSQ